MITKLSVANFKSVRRLDIDCKKVNLFIGEPNTGKSNILEALAMLSWCNQYSQPLSDYVRFEFMQNLFYDGLLDDEVRVGMSLSSGQPIGELYVRFTRDRFEFRSQAVTSQRFREVNHQGEGEGGATHPRTGDIKFYRFKGLATYGGSEPGSLKPPDGANLFSSVFSSKALRETMVEFFRKYGLTVVMKPHDRVFSIQKQVDGIVVELPYALQSDTLRRIIFYTVAMASNKDSVLVFEEAESNAFPYYTKHLGERIALDETNQFFIATHNPYLLSAVIEKARVEDVQVFITYFENYQTKVKPLSADQVSELMEADPFFNLDRFLEEGR
ncbi:AAA family ATPase [Anaerobaca lacustris]|uniref:AAA family ATPase n=1 Tax=Anaerobaca lacustris TaxID=3044600 RepID=A0AAW6TWU7_9BACT|nr:AAA family ATPase [Sedimentisphaerales bacterium M17dextr]